MANILIIDDYSSVRELLIEELACEGHTVVALSTIEGIEELIERSKPDVIIFDPIVRGKNQLHTVRNIKEHHPFLPVLIIAVGDDYEEDLYLSQVDGYVIMSSCLDELKQKIAHIVQQTQRFRPDHKDRGNLLYPSSPALF